MTVELVRVKIHSSRADLLLSSHEMYVLFLHSLFNVLHTVHNIAIIH